MCRAITELIEDGRQEGIREERENTRREAERAEKAEERAEQAEERAEQEKARAEKAEKELLQMREFIKRNGLVLN